MTELNSALSISGSFDYAELSDPASSLLQAAKEMQYRPDPEAAAFPRVCKLASDRSISWFIPSTEIKEVNADICAVRGFIIEPKFGFRLFDSEEKRSICNTTSLELPSGMKVENQMPMPLPIYSPQKFGTSQPADALHKWGLMGSRGKSCAECVLAGENTKSYTDAAGKPQTDSCGLNSKVLFYVTQVGINKYNAATRSTSVSWVNVVDLKDDEGQPLYQTPFILTMQISRMPVTKAIGANLQVKTVSNGGTAPEGSQTLQSFLNGMHKSGQVVATRNGKLIYRACVEMHLAQPTEAFAKSMSTMVKSIPVFSVYTSERLEADGGLEKMLVLAHQQYEADLKAAGGDSKPAITPVSEVKPRFTPKQSAAKAAEVAEESLEEEIGEVPTFFARQQ